MFYYTCWKVWTSENMDGEIIFIASLSSLYDNKVNLTIEHETGRSLIAR